MRRGPPASQEVAREYTSPEKRRKLHQETRRHRLGGGEKGRRVSGRQ